MGAQFQSSVEQALATVPYATGAGRVLPTRTPIHLGFPGGSHDIEPAWIYERASSTLEMVFRFYNNFTPNDLICKVVRAGDYPRSGEGASVQFNASRCVVTEGLEQHLVHHGEVTVDTKIARQHLVEVLGKVCPREAALAGIRDSAPSSWPVSIGTTGDLPSLLDHLFVYAYCIEQAKRHIRDEPPLASFL